jgi:hypothetical protein
VEPLRLDDPGEGLGVHVADVGLAAVDEVGLAGVDLEADGAQALAGELDGQRQADVAQPDHTHPRALCLDEALDLFFDHDFSVQRFRIPSTD